MNAETIQATPVVSETPPGFLKEFRSSWDSLSCKWFFFSLLAAWLALFHFIGNSTLGYVNIPSLMGWMFHLYNIPGSEDGHGNLILPAVLVLLWWRRKILLAIPQRTWWPGIFIIGFALVIHVFGFLVQQPRISICGMFLGIYGLIGLTWGARWLQATFFPFILFVFCIPVGGFVETVTFPLRLLATNITYGVTHGILGLTVIKKGTQLFDANGAYSYDVAAACSGIRSLISLLALTTIYGMITFKSNWKRILVIAMAVPLAVASNVLRLTLIVVAAEAFGQKTGDFIHEWSGFLTYAVAIGAMLLLGWWLREKEERPAVLQPQTS
ncbi:MAG: exosortase/archaeosortase family protein [Verrucomicrobiota bacterium]